MIDYKKYTYKLFSTQDNNYATPCPAQGLKKVNGEYFLDFQHSLLPESLKDANGITKLKVFGLNVLGDRQGLDRDPDEKLGTWLIPELGTVTLNDHAGIDVKVSSDGIILLECSPSDTPTLINKAVHFQIKEVSLSDNQEFIVNVTISFKRTYSKETLYMFYKIGAGKFIKKDIKCVNVTDYPYYDAITEQGFTIELKLEDWDKTLEYYVVRPSLEIPYTNSSGVLQTDNTIFPEQVIVPNTLITLPRHMQRFNYECTADPDYKLLFSFRVVFDVECAKSHYYINKIDFEGGNSLLVVDILITDGDETHINTENDDDSDSIQTIGKTLIYKQDVHTDEDGYFIDEQGKRYKIFIEGIEDNSTYMIYALLKSTGQLYQYKGTTNTNLLIGINDILNKIHWPGELVLLNTNTEIQMSSSASDDGLHWFFDLGGNLKSSASNPNRTGYAHGSRGAIIYENGVSNEVNPKMDIQLITSISNILESYNCMKFYEGKKIILGNTYTKENYDDKGLGDNIFPNDVIGIIPYCKRYSNNINGPEEGKSRHNTLFLKFYTEATSFDLAEIKSGNNIFKVSISSGTIKLLYTTDSGTRTVPYSVSLNPNTWYSLFLIFNDLAIKGISIYQNTTKVFSKILPAEDLIDLSGLINPNIIPTTFLEYTESDCISFPSSNSNADIYLCKIGLVFRDLSYNISELEDINILDYIGNEVSKIVLQGYTMMPIVTLTPKDASVPPVIINKFTEIKREGVGFYLPLNEYAEDGDTCIKSVLPKGEYTLKLECSGVTYISQDIQIKSIKPDDDTIGFVCDFKNDYDNAIQTFIDRFYIRQEKRAGDLSGGENGNNVYFNEGEGCLVLENHGDYYGEEEDQLLPCNQKSPVTSYYIGAPAEMVKYDLNEDGSINYYDPEHTPNPYKTRVTRVGSLVQSKDYYGYGEWKMRMKIPKDFTGAAICWWVFHYQEHYPNDNDNRYFDFYTGGLDNQDRAITKSLLGGYDVDGEHEYAESYLPFNYRHDYKTDSGKPFLTINNEIDMELGSEMCSVYSQVPPTQSEETFHISAIDSKTVCFCTSEGENYGLWVVDYEHIKTQSALRAKFDALHTEYEENGTVNRYTSPNVIIKLKDLEWVHISTDPNILEKGPEWLKWEAHKTWSIRWNNWYCEGDNTTGQLHINNALTNVVDIFKTGTSDKLSGWGALNVGASMTLRTPLGQWDIHNEDINRRFIPHRYDDDQYHDYRFEYRRDYTAIYIDNKLVKVNRMNVPFIPMAALIGIWFPSVNSYDVSKYAGHFGGWGGLDAKWDVRHAKVSYISYTPYSAEEEPRDKMIYHSESFPADGLRKIEGIYKEGEKVTFKVKPIPDNAIVYINDIQTNSLQVKTGLTVQVKVSAEGYNTFQDSFLVNAATEKTITLLAISAPGMDSITTMELDKARIAEKLNTLKEEFGEENLVIWSLVTDQHATINDGLKQDNPQTKRQEEITKWMQALREFGEELGFSVFLNGGDVTGYLGSLGNVIDNTELPNPLNADGTIPGNEDYTSGELTAKNQNILDTYYTTEYNACVGAFTDNPTIPMMFAPGNHDRLGSAGSYKCYVPLSFTKNLTVTPFEGMIHPIFDGVEQDLDSNYIYYDDEEKKVRFIVFDSYYEKWKKKWFNIQKEGLDNKALKKCINNSGKDSSWKYIILQHDGYTRNEGALIPNSEHTYTDCEEDVDFSDIDTSNLIVCLNGHGHISNQALIPGLNDTFEIITLSSSSASGIFSSRQRSWDVTPDVPYIDIGTVSGHAIDIFVYNKTNEDLTIFRWGAGSDRYFNLNKLNPVFKYVTYKATFHSDSITDFSGYKLLLSSRLDGLYYQNKMYGYKNNIFINLSKEGVADSAKNEDTQLKNNVKGIPCHTTLRAYLINTNNVSVWCSDVFTTEDLPFNIDINLDF